MNDDGAAPPRRLTAGQRGVLAQCAVWLWTAGDDTDWDLAVATAVAAARRCRSAGARWAEIAEALGVAERQLREWRGGISAKPPAGPLPSSADRRSAGQLSRTVLIALGDPVVNGNDFAKEAATIRWLLDLHGVTVIERSNIEITEIRRELDAANPAVLHLAAHSDFGAVHLHAGSLRSAILHADVHQTVRSAVQPPLMVVLSCCDTEQLARSLTTRGAVRGGPTVHTAIGWRGAVTDEQAHLFAEVFYRRLAEPAAVGPSFGDAHLAVTSRWKGQAEPRLFGDAAAVPLAHG
jgi:hypothetical protein